MKPQTREYLTKFSATVAETYPVIRTPEEQAKDFAALIRNADEALEESSALKLELELVRISKSLDGKVLFIDIVDEKVATRFAAINLSDDLGSHPYSVQFGKGKRLNGAVYGKLSSNDFDSPVAIIPDLFLPSDDDQFSFNFLLMPPETKLAVLADVLGDFQHVETVS